VIEPVSVFGDDEEERLRGELAEQLEHRQADEIPIRHRGVHQAHGAAERSPLRRRELLDPSTDGMHDL
jgi:hypothetical protein